MANQEKKFGMLGQCPQAQAPLFYTYIEQYTRLQAKAFMVSRAILAITEKLAHFS
jgi:hypothetical protein